MKPNIVLIGLSGSGKSTSAQRIAERLGWSSIDTDAQIEQSEAEPITAIFAQRGEPAFRDLEARFIQSAMEGEHRVVATGGGAILSSENRAALWSRGFVVYLRTSPATLAQRLHREGADERPLLEGDVLRRLESLLEARSGYYEQAHAVIDTDAATPDTIAEMVVHAYEHSN